MFDVEVTVSVQLYNRSSVSTFRDPDPQSQGGRISKTIRLDAPGPTERYAYLAAEKAAAQATESVLEMVEAGFGRAKREHP